MATEGGKSRTWEKRKTIVEPVLIVLRAISLGVWPKGDVRVRDTRGGGVEIGLPRGRMEEVGGSETVVEGLARERVMARDKRSVKIGGLYIFGGREELW